MPLQQNLDDKAIAFRVYELMEAGLKVEVGDQIKVILAPTFTMRARGEWCQPTDERVEERHIQQAKRLLDTPIAQWDESWL